MSATGNAEQEKQMKSMLTFMLVFIVIASFNLSTAIALYWVVTNGFAIFQTIIFNKLSNRKVKTNKKTTIKEKLQTKKGV